MFRLKYDEDPATSTVNRLSLHTVQKNPGQKRLGKISKGMSDHRKSIVSFKDNLASQSL